MTGWTWLTDINQHSRPNRGDPSSQPRTDGSRLCGTHKGGGCGGGWVLHSSSVARRWPCSLSSRGLLCATTCPQGPTVSHLGALVSLPTDPGTCPGTSLGSAGCLSLGNWDPRDLESSAGMPTWPWGGGTDPTGRAGGAETRWPELGQLPTHALAQTPEGKHRRAVPKVGVRVAPGSLGGSHEYAKRLLAGGRGSRKGAGSARGLKVSAEAAAARRGGR